jgi:hypothetical protein
LDCRTRLDIVSRSRMAPEGVLFVDPDSNPLVVLTGKLNVEAVERVALLPGLVANASQQDKVEEPIEVLTNRLLDLVLRFSVRRQCRFLVHGAQMLNRWTPAREKWPTYREVGASGRRIRSARQFNDGPLSRASANATTSSVLPAGALRLLPSRLVAPSHSTVSRSSRMDTSCGAQCLLVTVARWTLSVRPTCMPRVGPCARSVPS